MCALYKPQNLIKKCHVQAEKKELFDGRIMKKIIAIIWFDSFWVFIMVQATQSVIIAYLDFCVKCSKNAIAIILLFLCFNC